MDTDSQLTCQECPAECVVPPPKVSAFILSILLPLVLCSLFEDDNIPFTSLHLRIALDERFGPSFPGWSATCQYTLSEICSRLRFYLHTHTVYCCDDWVLTSFDFRF